MMSDSTCELALVSATPQGFDELARVPAIKERPGNTPTIVPSADGHPLLVRTGAQMVVYRLPTPGVALVGARRRDRPGCLPVPATSNRTV